MADRVELRLGQVPWRPTPDAELVATYRYYDGPLTGVVAQHGNEYVFSCLDGVDETLSLWYFAPIRREQRERLEALPGAEFEHAFRDEPIDGCWVLALVHERLGIVAFEAVEDTDDGDVMEDHMKAALTALQHRLIEMSQDAEHLEFTLAQ